MKAIALFFFAMFISVGLCACDESTGDNEKISIDVLRAFGEKFPQAKDVDWDTHGRYYVAEFKSPAGWVQSEEITGAGATPEVLYEMEAWFDTAANWRMTVIDATYTMLPNSVQHGFTTSTYGAWKVDDVDIVQRNGKEPVYILEVKQGKVERELYFNSNGVLTHEKKHSSDDYRDLL